ncbi:MAG: hypothetical protein ABSA05_16190 [Opitutaceae bacterium]|jgi:hypothetical protein
MGAILPALARAVRAARFWRLVAVFLASVAAGLISDWFRTEQRLVFPRPPPVFVPMEPGR